MFEKFLFESETTNNKVAKTGFTSVFLCFVTIMFVLSIVLTSSFSLFYVTRERNKFLHRG